MRARDDARPPIERAAGQLLHELGHGYLIPESDAARAAAVLATLVPARDYGRGPSGALEVAPTPSR